MNEAMDANIQHAVQTSIGAALDASTVDADPFSHAYLCGVFPSSIYAQMIDSLPSLDVFTPDNPAKYGDATRLSSRYTLPLNEVGLAALPPAQRALWLGIGAALGSSAVKDQVFEKLADDLCRRFRVDRSALLRMPAYPRPTLLRDLSGYWIAPHPDSRAKIVTVQFYLARDASQRTLGTTLYRRRLLNPRILLSPSNMFEPVRQLEFLPNSGYMFPVGRRSWHGREALPPNSGERNSILLVYYLDPSREW